ncbi:AraC family transcriptional regulator [Acetivibrio cellulolyticus]|uniref:AraC family transcriptional regulator n=1 Tax=Acetivibrio cellulolyticus TaxID=35830 RepID=UPI0001E2F161|nr:AraC family transcriptional regulator [Acetivibrio cellulolyticus]
MEFSTMGQRFYPGYNMNLSYTDSNVFHCDLKNSNVFKFVLITSGNGIVSFNGKRLAFTSPSIFCMNENEDPFLEKGDNIKTLCLFFQPSIINSLYNYANIRDNSLKGFDSYDTAWLNPYTDRTNSNLGYMALSLATASRIKNLIELINSELTEQKDGSWPCRSRSYLLELMLITERSFSSAPKDTLILPDNNNIDDIVMYIFSNYQQKITLLELSKIFHINRTSMNQAFTKMTGFSVMTFLIRHRIQVAQLLLRDTMLTISEVSERVGFNDLTHFTRMFKKYAGETPSDYRKKNCWMLSLYS